MREIKFRAWDITKKEMVSVFRTDSHPDLSAPHSIIAGIAEDGHIVSRPLLNLEGQDPEFILMQYTGLKDKGDVEVCEGDIIKLTEEDGATQKSEVASENFFVEFVVDEVSFQLDHTSGLSNLGGHDLPLLLVMGKGEVVGNIHQHKNLLDTKTEM